jgi:hypothetical protein
LRQQIARQPEHPETIDVLQGERIPFQSVRFLRWVVQDRILVPRNVPEESQVPHVPEIIDFLAFQPQLTHEPIQLGLRLVIHFIIGIQISNFLGRWTYPEIVHLRVGREVQLVDVHWGDDGTITEEVHSELTRSAEHLHSFWWFVRDERFLSGGWIFGLRVGSDENCHFNSLRDGFIVRLLDGGLVFLVGALHDVFSCAVD